ncbi:MAG: Hsp20/alpha crystallin family protein [Betaproteobacteria bacterium]
MRSRVHAVVVPPELGEFGDDIRRIFLELGRTFGPETLTGECAPPLDVFETDDAVEVAMDLPGVDASAVRVVARGDALLIAGEKLAKRGNGESTFHLLERGFGRFARIVRLGRACDTGRATATLAGGELRISVPKIPERRGASLQIRVTRE